MVVKATSLNVTVIKEEVKVEVKVLNHLRHRKGQTSLNCEVQRRDGLIRSS